MKLKLEIVADNATFDEAPGFELGRILREAADKVEEWRDGVEPVGFALRDVNGNTVGQLTVTKGRREVARRGGV